jgi:flagellar hook-associated protein 1 FlgK
MNALKNLSGDLGVSYYISSNGGMQVYTTAGQPLLVGNTVNQLSHTAVSIDENTTYPSGGIGGIMVGNTDITTQISSGSLAALIQQRDTELPNAQNSLDTLAQSLSGVLNTISNQGSANPPPATLTSAAGTSYAPTDAVSPSVAAPGPPATQDLTIRVAMVDSTGTVQSYQDVNLSTAVTVNDVVNDINTAFGSPTPPVASLSGSGQLVLSSTASGQGIAVGTVSGTLNNTNFSAYFHLNDVISGGTSARTIQVNSALLSNANLFPTASLNTSGTTVPYAGIGNGDGTTATALENALLGTQTYTANTATGTTAETSTTTPLGLSGSFSIAGGSGPVGVTVTSTMTLSDIAAAINTAAGTSGVTASVVGNGAYQLQIDSGNTSLSFTNVSGNVLSSLGLSSSPSGYLGATTTTLAGYATSIISDVATRASNAATAATTQQTTLTTMTSNLSSQSGVNTDEESAHLVELQNAYAASAKVVSTVQAMFTALLQAVS